MQGWNWGRQIFQSETWKRELILSSSFFGGEGGGWLGATRPSDTRDHPDRTTLRCLKAPAFVSMTCGPNRWLAHLSCNQRQVPLRHQSSVREGEGVVVIKLLGLVRVDATHQSTALDISLFTHFKWTTLYVDIFCFVCSHLLQSLKRLVFGNGGSTTHACMP